MAKKQIWYKKEKQLKRSLFQCEAGQQEWKDVFCTYMRMGLGSMAGMGQMLCFHQ